LAGITRTAARNYTWEWDGTRWIQRTPTVSPTAMGQFVMTFDATRRVSGLSRGCELPLIAAGVPKSSEGASASASVSAHTP
jgi:hypothetical protein